MRRFWFSVFVPVLIASGQPCRAAELARYLFSSASPASVDTNTATVAGSFGVGAAGTNWAFSSIQANVFGRGNTTASTETSAVASGSYFTFTLTPVSLGAGAGINLTSLTFDTLSNNAGSVSGSATATFFVRSSLDGFSANIGSLFTQAYNTDTTVNPVARTIDLSAYQGIVSAIEFRIYVFDDTGDVNRTPRLDNVILNGAVAPLPAIPEPSTAAVLAGGAILAFVLRRRRA